MCELIYRLESTQKWKSRSRNVGYRTGREEGKTEGKEQEGTGKDEEDM